MRLGPGLKPYTDEIDTIIISGMGGRNIIGICKEDLSVLKKVKTLILSPNNYQEDVKRFICQNGFYIEKEEFVKDKNFIYQIIIFQKGKRKYSKKEYFMGPVFLEKKGPLFQEYYKREYESRKILLKILPKKHIYKRWKLKKEMEMIQKEID